MVGIKGQPWSPRSPIFPVYFLSAVPWNRDRSCQGLSSHFCGLASAGCLVPVQAWPLCPSPWDD